MSDLSDWEPVAKIYDPIKAGSIDGLETELHDQGICKAINANYQPDPRLTNKPENTIFVARLNVRTTKETLMEVFSQYGKITNCKLIKDVITGFSKGYAFIEYECDSSVALACEANKMELEGRTIFVDRECERQVPGWVPRRLGGGLGGHKLSGQLRFGGKDCPFIKPVSPNKDVKA